MSVGGVIELYLPLLDKTVYCSLSKTHTNVWLIEPQIYHPKIQTVGCIYVGSIGMLKTSLRFGIARHELSYVVKVNERIDEVRNASEECCICFEKMISKRDFRLTCVKFHGVCYACFLQLDKCPICRDDILKERRHIKKYIF